jgi:hypothetical protein
MITDLVAGRTSAGSRARRSARCTTSR